MNSHTGELRHCDTVGAELAAQPVVYGKPTVPQLNSLAARDRGMTFGPRGPAPAAMPATPSILEGLPCIVVRRVTAGV